MLYLLLYWTLVWYCENATPVWDRSHYAAIKKLFLVPQILKNSFFWLIFKSFALGKYKLTENPADSNLWQPTLEIEVTALTDFARTTDMCL